MLNILDIRENDKKKIPQNHQKNQTRSFIRYIPNAHRLMVHRRRQRKKKVKGDPLTTQASSAAARSSRPGVASRALGTGAAKI